jgi:hypothetical protein
MGEENCPTQSGVQSWQQNAKNLAISAENGNKKVTQNCNTCAGKFMGRKFPAPKGAKQGGMSDVEKERILGSSERQPSSSFSCRLHFD